jgi:site-specific recombinase XerD
MKHANVSFIIKMNRKNVQGRCPVVCRITVCGETTEISPGITICPEDWDSKKRRVKSRHADSRVLNERLAYLEATINRNAADLRLKGDSFTAADIKRLSIDGDNSGLLMQLITKHNQDVFRRVGRDYSKATYGKFEVTRKKVIDFLKTQYGSTDIQLTKLNHDFVIRFESFLKVNHKLGHNSAMKHIKNLKKVMRLALRLDLLTKNPLEGFRCTTREVVRECLTQTELNRLSQKDTLDSRLEAVRDVFLFSCYTGLSYSDVAKLRESHLFSSGNGLRMIVIPRTKTGVVSRVPVLPAAEKLIARYQPLSDAYQTDKLFPVRSNQKMNEYLKELATVCEIQKRLTFHLARHTFATTISLANGITMEVLRTMLGHRNIRTTEIYAKMTDLRVQEEMHRLSNKLANTSSI